MSSPHPRGDGPNRIWVTLTLVLFSPPAWGWSALQRQQRPLQRVLPTRVGMVRSVMSRLVYLGGSPHPRGDGPRGRPAGVAEKLFSPPAWGWSGCGASFLTPPPVLPTRVGMVRSALPFSTCRTGSPHPRGDGPHFFPHDVDYREFSPPAWGWSDQRHVTGQHTSVLPTRVGMVR